MIDLKFSVQPKIFLNHLTFSCLKLILNLGLYMLCSVMQKMLLQVTYQSAMVSVPRKETLQHRALQLMVTRP